MHAIVYLNSVTHRHMERSGWGAHGYTYRDTSKQPRKHFDYYITNKGYVDKNKMTDHQLVDPITFYDIIEPSTELPELVGLFKTLDYFMDKGLDTLTIYTVNSYVKSGLDKHIKVWMQNNWCRSDNVPIQKKETWIDLQSIIEQYRTLGITLNIEWGKSTTPIPGMELATNLAYISSSRDVTDNAKHTYVATEAKTYLSSDVIRHPFLCFKRMYFTSSVNISDQGYYYIAEPGDKDHNFGKRLSEASYGVVHFHKPVDILENIKHSQRYDLHTDFIKTVMLRLDRVYDKHIYPYLNKYGSDCLHNSNYDNINLDFIDGRNVSEEITPVGLSMRAMNNFTMLEMILNEYISNNGKLSGDYTVIDITGYFYDFSMVNGKSVCKLKTEYIVGFKDTQFTLDVDIHGKLYKIDVPIVLGGDLIPRNNLKKLESMDPKIDLIVYPESNMVIRYACIIKCSDAIGIWSNYNSDRVFLSQH